MAETITVTFSITALRRLRSAGNLLALATAEIDLAGVAMTLHGVAVTRLPNGNLQCSAPRYRTPTGEWAPAVTLPDELEIAIGGEVMAAFADLQVGR